MRGRLPSSQSSELKSAREFIIGYNIGAGLDIPQGVWHKTYRGNWQLSGGVFEIMLVSGGPNTFKTTFMHYSQLTVAARYNNGELLTLDTEQIFDSPRLDSLASSVPSWSGIRPSYLDKEERVGSSRIRILDGSMHLGELHKNLRSHLNNKLKAGKSVYGTLPFTNKAGEPIRSLFPTSFGLDSMTSVKLKQQEDLLDAAEVGEKENNMYDMTGGRIKAQFFTDVSTLAYKTNALIYLSSQIGKKFDMTGRGMLTKDMAFMKPDDKLDRCPDGAKQYSNVYYNFLKVEPLYNSSSDKTPKYPISKNDRFKDNTDLVKMRGIVVRSKRGVSGSPFTMVATQTHGIHPHLTEFHQISDKDEYRGYGIGDPTKMYSYLELLPDVKFMRTTVREIVESNRAFQQACTHTLEMAQMDRYYHDERRKMIASVDNPEENITPKEVYEKLTAAGYDVPWLMENTHSWWVHDEDNAPWYELSTMDMIEMARGTYHPYWLEADKKTVKPEWKKRKEADLADRMGLKDDIEQYIIEHSG